MIKVELIDSQGVTHIATVAQETIDNWKKVGIKFKVLEQAKTPDVLKGKDPTEK